VPDRKKAAKIPSGSLDTVMRGQASERKQSFDSLYLGWRKGRYKDEDQDTRRRIRKGKQDRWKKEKSEIRWNEEERLSRAVAQLLIAVNDLIQIRC
jgi:hypothetical protein